MKTEQLTALCLCLLAASLLAACGNRSEKQRSSTEIPVQPDSVVQTTGVNPPSVSTDEQKFRTALSALQQAVEGDNEELVKSLVRFPLQTGKQWRNEDIKSSGIDREAGRISESEFKEYYPKIFNADVKRLLPKAGEDNSSRVENMDEDYYKTLQQETDQGSELYEVYMQYPGSNGSESYFAFVFGRVQDQYKVIGYHAKSPVKD